MSAITEEEIQELIKEVRSEILKDISAGTTPQELKEKKERILKFLRNEKRRNLPFKERLELQIQEEGKSRNPLPDILGKWPGDETDEEFEEIMRNLK